MTNIRFKFKFEPSFSFKSAKTSEKLVILGPEKESLGPNLVTLIMSPSPNTVTLSMSPDPNLVFLTRH